MYNFDLFEQFLAQSEAKQDKEFNESREDKKEGNFDAPFIELSTINEPKYKFLSKSNMISPNNDWEFEMTSKNTEIIRVVCTRNLPSKPNEFDIAKKQWLCNIRNYLDKFLA